MKRICALVFFFLWVQHVHAQLNHEWIDYSKTYYKFKVGTNGLHRIPYTLLQNLGLSTIPLEQFQLFRNGVEVPLFTSKTVGVPGTADFIEFYGQRNDGKADLALYRNATDQLNPTSSLFTDTAAYFLTINSSGTAIRIVNEENNLASNTLPPEPFFVYTFVRSFRDKLNGGYAYVENGNYVYSSSYDPGEGWTSRDVYPGSPLTETYMLYPYANTGTASLTISYGGNAANTRNVDVTLNNNSLFNESLIGFAVNQKTFNFPLNVLRNIGGEVLTIKNSSGTASDRIVVGELKLTYPRQFNFGGSSVFEFSLPASTLGNYLEISNFNSGASDPILFDVTNKKRYVGIVKDNSIRFLLKPSSQQRSLVLLSADAITSVATVEKRNFTDLRNASAQGDYLIITNKKLTQGASGNPIENYRAYRASSAGGGFNAKVYDVSELIDQFGFGIRGNPLSIKHFIQFARNQFGIKPQYIFLIGRGLLYNDARWYESYASTYDMNLVPTFGSPGSDNLLASPGLDVNVDIPIGRLAAISAEEVENYLQKVTQHESQKNTAANTIRDRAWRKNVVHAIGGSDPFLQSVLTGYMNGYKKVAQDTLWGANVHSFSKSVNINADLLTSDQLAKQFEEGISLLTYFGHSATDILEFNIDAPETYNNVGKYPFFLVNGCYAGNIFIYDTARLKGIGLTLSEKYMMAKDRGSIGFLANTHTGIVNYLNVFTDGFYRALAREQYGKPYGDVFKSTLLTFASSVSSADFFGRTHKEQMVLHADPALATSTYLLPDFVVEDPMVKISPSPLSVADKEFKLMIRIANVGKAINDSIRVLIQRKLPNGSVIDIFNKKIGAPRQEDSLYFTIPINPLSDKGSNRISVMLDADNKITEQSEVNNTVYKDFTIIEDVVRPVYPLAYAVLGQPVTNFYASVANPLAAASNYLFEIDSTEQFNSPIKVSTTIQGSGGLVKFTPTGINWKDSTVYYWRTAPQSNTGATNWSSASFMYLKNNPNGFGQAHYYQHLKSDYEKISLDNNRVFIYDSTSKKLAIKTGLYPYYVNNKLYSSIDELQIVNYGCRYSSIQILVLDAHTLKPWENTLQANGNGLYNSWPPCEHNYMAFEFPYADPVYRKRAVEFLEGLPSGVIVSITNFGRIENASFIGDWMTDTTSLGRNRSLYHVLKKMGFSYLDQFTRNLPFVFVAKKNGAVLKQVMGDAESAYIDESISVTSFAVEGKITSPWFGPAVSWTGLKWNGKELQPLSDAYTIELISKDLTGSETTLFATSNKDTSLAGIDAKKYPYLRLKLNAKDTIYASPFQLNYWILTGKFAPEGAISSEYYLKAKDTIDVGEPYLFEMAFKNISSTSFDSLQASLSITNSSNVTTDIPLKKLRPIGEGDTVVVRQWIDSRKLSKDNLLFIQFNPNGLQPEQYLFNNFLYRSLYVRPDEYKPVLDVTFDGVRILSEDIVSSKPHILVKLTDNNKYLMLDDTALLTVKVRYPNNQVKTFHFNTDTLRFSPAIYSNGSKENAATIDFLPFFKEDGLYELIITGADKSGNSSGLIEYKVAFNVVNKAMISNLLNYPNPFTTSTAFVFTLTGSQVPHQLRIQILTITGKIVREITKEALGPIHIGKNITEYKWDGTDQFGQKLANGVYLYRVITSLNGRSMDKLESANGILSADQKYFTNGYGKMYLLR